MAPITGGTSAGFSDRGDGLDNLVTQTITTEYDASEDGTGRGTPLVVDTVTAERGRHPEGGGGI